VTIRIIGAMNNMPHKTIPKRKRMESFRLGQTVHINSAKPAAGMSKAKTRARIAMAMESNAVIKQIISQNAPND
jgi:hypothetical protein